MGNPGRDVAEAIKGLRLQNETADMTLSCGVNDMKVHALILGCRSTFFNAIIKNGFKETATRVIELPEDDVNLVSKMVIYIYGSRYRADNNLLEETRDCDLPYVSALHTHTGMYQMGDKFGIPGLKQHALERFVEVLEVRENHCNEVDEMAAVIPIIYETTPKTDRGLRDLALAWVKRNKNRLSGEPAFGKLMLEIQEFNFELVFGDANLTTDFFPAETCYRCSSTEE